ncbi:MAG TPA: PIN domain-containing protein [Pyrinomonadaceae bacterium]|jgi:rRNA-processing protein FCF1
MRQLDYLLGKYKSKGVLIDTNLLLLYFVGLYDPQFVPKFKRTMTFAVEDFFTLLRFFEYFGKVVTTPNILTEVNSLANQLPNNIKLAFYPIFAAQIAALDEQYIESSKVSSTPHFIKLGLTDTGILNLPPGRHLVLTDDFPLAGHLDKQGIDVINFNHVRTLNWS